MTRKEAIKGSLDKWNAICADEIDMGEATEYCALCEEYREFEEDEDDDECCPGCPLCEVGQGCLDRGSAWSKMDIILKNKYYGKYGIIPEKIGTLSEQDCCLQLADHCNEIKKTLQKLYDAEE